MLNNLHPSTRKNLGKFGSYRIKLRKIYDFRKLEGKSRTQEKFEIQIRVWYCDMMSIMNLLPLKFHLANDNLIPANSY